uniref:Uncharacterized protein n=1 Tax=Caenorhabditis japonica TaxID=281687 RepID=A0A8R1EGY8_CAEJA
MQCGRTDGRTQDEGLEEGAAQRNATEGVNTMDVSGCERKERRKREEEEDKDRSSQCCDWLPQGNPLEKRILQGATRIERLEMFLMYKG